MFLFSCNGEAIVVNDNKGVYGRGEIISVSFPIDTIGEAIKSLYYRLIGVKSYVRYTMFQNREYAASFYLTSYNYRYGFMRSRGRSYEIGNIFVSPRMRRKGYAKHLISSVLHSLDMANQYYYIVEAKNVSSIRLAESLGLSKIGNVSRVNRLPFSKYRLEEG